jgi:hypothetical protein
MVDDPKDEDYQHNPRRGVSQSCQTFLPLAKMQNKILFAHGKPF